MKDTKMGRPTECVKKIIVKARIDEETEKQLQYCIENTDKSKSDIIREGILKIYSELKENEK